MSVVMVVVVLMSLMSVVLMTLMSVVLMTVVVPLMTMVMMSMTISLSWLSICAEGHLTLVESSVCGGKSEEFTVVYLIGKIVMMVRRFGDNGLLGDIGNCDVGGHICNNSCMVGMRMMNM